MNNMETNLTFSNELHRLKLLTTKRRSGRGGSQIFRESQRGTPGRRATRRLNDEAVARAVAKHPTGSALSNFRS